MRQPNNTTDIVHRKSWTSVKSKWYVIWIYHHFPVYLFLVNRPNLNWNNRACQQRRSSCVFHVGKNAEDQLLGQITDIAKDISHTYLYEKKLFIPFSFCLIACWQTKEALQGSRIKLDLCGGHLWTLCHSLLHWNRVNDLSSIPWPKLHVTLVNKIFFSNTTENKEQPSWMSGGLAKLRCNC